VIDQLRKDRIRRPDLFHSFGPIEPEKLDAWLRECKFVIPHDLREFWCETGGGDLFETETVLGPFASADLADNVEAMYRWHRQKGMPADWLLFHIGAGLSVVKMSSGEYATVQPGSYEVKDTFASLEDWYNRLLRKEYALRYGLG